MCRKNDPRRVWRSCDWCRETGKSLDGREPCGMCKGHKGWWVSEPFPADDGSPLGANAESAGAWWLNALMLAGLLVVTWAA